MDYELCPGTKFIQKLSCELCLRSKFMDCELCPGSQFIQMGLYELCPRAKFMKCELCLGTQFIQKATPHDILYILTSGWGGGCRVEGGWSNGWDKMAKD